MGHKKRKPTTIATNMLELLELNGIRGEPENEQKAFEAFRCMSLQQRIQESKTWATLAPGLKEAIATALNRHIQRLMGELEATTQPAMRPLNRVALEAWKNHFLNDHLPARRDCAQCIRAQARSRPHRKVVHPEAYTLSVDLSGRMTAGQDQEHQRRKYLMVACYTFPVTGHGRPLVNPPGAPSDEQDHPLPAMDLSGGEGTAANPLPSMDLHGGEGSANHDGVHDSDEVFMDDEGGQPPEPEDPRELPEPDDPLCEEAPLPAASDGPREDAMRGADEVWHKMIEEATNVGVKNLTFVELLSSRSVSEVMPALARIHARAPCTTSSL